MQLRDLLSNQRGRHSISKNIIDYQITQKLLRSNDWPDAKDGWEANQIFEFRKTTSCIVHISK